MVKERKGSQKEHCQECLSRSQPEHPLEAENEKQTVDELDTCTVPIRKKEMIKDMKKLKNGKAGGIDGMVEILNIDIDKAAHCLEKNILK